MLEMIKHTFGFCGEHWHPNIWTFLGGTVGLLPGYSYIKYKLNRNK
jgi:hypothetical protein